MGPNEKPLAKTSCVDENHAFLCIQDDTPPRQFLNIDYEKLENETTRQEYTEIKKNFDALTEDINRIMKREYEKSDMKLFHISKNIFYPLVVFLFIALIFVGICALVSLSSFNLIAMLSIGGFLVVFIGGFFCCCDWNADQDESINERVKPAVDVWNSANKENGVIAEYIETKDEFRGKHIHEIPSSLCLWKRADSASNDNATRILELENKISDMENATRILELEKKISDMEKENSAMKKEKAYTEIGIEVDKKTENLNQNIYSHHHLTSPQKSQKITMYVTMKL